MKKRTLPFLLLVVFSFLFFLFLPHGLLIADETSELEKKIDECEKQITDLQKQADSLNQQISLMDGQIKITSLKITQSESQIKKLEEEIVALSGKIIRLDTSLDYLSKVLLARISETYKSGRFDFLTLFFSSQDFSDFVSRYRYLQTVQLHDRRLLLSMEQTRTSYDEQKQLKEKAQADLEKLQKQLQTQKQQLATQMADKKRLWAETKGKEAEYQRILLATKQELEAIQQIIAGKGEETEVGKVNEGERIASVISGVSACSTGTHLHFEVRENGDLKNPLSYLKNISLVDKSGGDSHQASGDWSWPLNEPIEFTQGFGENTSAIRSRTVWYKFHTGVDIVSQDKTVKTVKAGTLYQGGVACGRGTLRYVRVRNNDSSLDTYYLHVNY